MKKNKVSSVSKVYAAVVKLFKTGKPLLISKIAKVTKMSPEGARLNVLKLVALGKIKRDNMGHIIKVK